MFLAMLRPKVNWADGLTGWAVVYQLQLKLFFSIRLSMILMKFGVNDMRAKD